MDNRDVFEFELGRARIAIPTEVIMQNFLDALSSKPITSELVVSEGAPRIGEYWHGQGGVYIGICPGQNGAPDYHLIAPTDSPALLENVQWHSLRDEIAAANSDWDGLTNTRSMAEAGSELAGAILDIDIDGRRDFYLPARHELRIIKLIAPHLITKKWHWSSTQYSADTAWSQDLDDGDQDDTGKDHKLRARAVRRLLIIQ